MRSKSWVLQAGAQLMPLPANPVKMTRVVTEPTPSWRAEAAAVSESDPTFEQVSFTPHSLDLLIKASLEILEDSPNFNDVITQLLANVLAISLGTNGAQLPQGDLRDAMDALSTNNAATPTAAIMHLLTYYCIDGWVDSTVNRLSCPMHCRRSRSWRQRKYRLSRCKALRMTPVRSCLVISRNWKSGFGLHWTCKLLACCAALKDKSGFLHRLCGVSGEREGRFHLEGGITL
jgi:Phage capsid family